MCQPRPGVLYAVGLAQVTDCNLKGLSIVLADRAEIYDNVVRGDGVSIYRSSAATITGNLVEQSAVGVSVLHSGTATLTRNVLRENHVGLDSSFATIRAIRNRIVANTDLGVAVSDVGIDLIRNVISRNYGDGVRAQFAEGLLKEEPRGSERRRRHRRTTSTASSTGREDNHTWWNGDLGIEAPPDTRRRQLGQAQRQPAPVRAGVAVQHEREAEGVRRFGCADFLA